MSEPVRCPTCGESPSTAPDTVGRVQAFVVWCNQCNHGHKKSHHAAYALTLERAIEMWNDAVTKATQS
jgi:hypothetical protein